VIETLAEARDAGMRITARCAWADARHQVHSRVQGANRARPWHAHLDAGRGVFCLDARRPIEMPALRITARRTLRPAIDPNLEARIGVGD